ncbi:MAG: Uncharacterized protein G01um101425_565 [Candidatus Peregrinibacteria bacterium Gr01-1014_25]|nr:MAG: Uncharacterized protein G01um101425_565 [Candidatus Peregrinibacteria bacterium Gr01-1014_25]
MFQRPRHRRGPYALATEQRAFPRLARLALLIVVMILAFSVVRWGLRIIGVGAMRPEGVQLIAETTGAVSVSVDGEALKNPDEDLSLFADDRVVTTTSGRARLVFFDGTVVRLDRDTDVTVEESGRNDEEGALSLRLAKGRLWVRSPMAAAYSGAVMRSIETSTLLAELPAGSEVLVGNASVRVLAADGLGLTVTPSESDAATIVGEGQEFLLPDTLPEEGIADGYAFRSPLALSVFTDAFLLESRLRAIGQGRAAGTAPRQSDTLVVTSPVEGERVTGSVVTVAGTVSDIVDRVRVNGYMATLDRTRGTFRQDITLPEQESVDIRVEALSMEGLTIDDVRRTVKREQGTVTVSGLAAPTITAPASAGSAFRFPGEEITLRGSVPPGTAAVVVNDYQLQLYKPGNPTWSYVAGIRLGNLLPGRNIFDVYAVDAAGQRSPAARITIVQEEGTEGVIASDGAASSSPVASSATSIPLKNNPPLLPGTLTVTSPEGGSAVVQEALVVLEGTVPPGTAGVWVNDYRLQFFVASQSSWRFIARGEWGSLKPGKNVFRIVARNAAGDVLDALAFPVEWQQAASSSAGTTSVTNSR